MAHILIGSTIALFRAPSLLVWAVFGSWLAKELLGDIPNSGFDWLVVADSVADPIFGAFGFWLTRYKLRCANCQQTFPSYWKYRDDKSE
jgi:hypothetical protein